MEQEQSLILRNRVHAELLEIKTVEEGVTYLNKLNAIDVWVKAEKQDAELQNIIAEQKLRTQRIIGVILDNTELHSGGNPNRLPNVTGSKLSDIGLTKRQSSTFQQIASIPDQDFEEFIQDKKTAVNNAVAELTTTGAVRLAKSIDQKRKDIKTVSNLNERVRLNEEIEKLAREINQKYFIEQRTYLVSLIKI